MLIIKRNKDIVSFDKQKIVNAINKALIEVDGELYETDTSEDIANEIYKELLINNDTPTIEDIQDMVEEKLMESERKDVAKAYIRYRYDKEKERILKNDLDSRYNRFNNLITGNDEESNKENSNKDTRIIPTMRDYIAGFTCKDMAKRIFPKYLWDAHEQGIIHIHDTDYSPAMPMHNCDLINLEDMLQNGTVISETLIEKPKSFRTACTVATQIITQVASSQYGGNTISLAHLAPFVDISRKKIKERIESKFVNIKSYDDESPTYLKMLEKEIDKLVEDEVLAEIRDGIQTIQYQLITMSTTNGQAPFTSIFMWIDEAYDEQLKHDLALIIKEVLTQRIQGVKNKKGVYITTAFPKLLYCLDENNIHEDSKYWYLTQLAAECSAKRLVPDYISAKKMRELKNGQVFGCMGCRSFLQDYVDPRTGKHKFWGRFNQGVCTLNLVDVALSSNKDFTKFWQILDERLQMCYDVLMIRHNRLKGTKSDVAPILWQHGALARLAPGETIDELLYNDYSSISLGYAGLYECIHYMTGSSQLEDIGYNFGIKVMSYLNETTKKWKEQTNIGFSLYGSPIESTTYKFAKCLKKRFGEIPEVTDKNYVTNSYHITPSQEIDAFNKLRIEADFQKLSPGGAISYIETPNMIKNIPALIEIIKYIYDNIMYAEINTMTSYCHECGCTDIKMGNDLNFHCPQCGNSDFNKMNIALRICGYISTNPFNEGRAEDIYARKHHLD